MTDDGWSAKNETPIVDITSLRATIKFESGKGISQKKGALGMSLQTPRALSTNDVKLLEAITESGSAPTKAAPTKAAPTKAAASSVNEKTAKAKVTAARKPRSGSNTAIESKPEAKTDVIQYTPDALKFLYPQSAADVVAGGQKAPGTLKSQWKKLSKRSGFTPPDPALSGDLQVAAEQAVSLMCPVEPAILKGDDAAILVAANSTTSLDSCCRYLIARIGLLETLEALIRAHAYPVPSEYPIRFDQSAKVPLFHEALYDAFLMEDEEAQGNYRERVEEAYGAGDLVLRISLVACLRSRRDWGDECARAFLEQDTIKFSGMLLYAMSDASLARRLTADTPGFTADIINIVPGLRERSVPFFADCLESRTHYPRDQHYYARALSCIGTAEAAAVLVVHMRKKYVRPYVTDYFARFPELAPAALSTLAKKKTRLAAVAREILENVERAAKATSSDIEVAMDDEVPSILRDPPWHTAERAKRRLESVPDLIIPDEPAHLHWSELSVRDWQVENFSKRRQRLSAAQVAEFEENIAQGKSTTFRAGLPARLINKYLSELPACLAVYEADLNQALASEGEPVLKAVLNAHKKRNGRDLSPELIMHIEYPP